MAAAATAVRRPAVPPTAPSGHGAPAALNAATGVTSGVPMAPPPPSPPLPLPSPAGARAGPAAGDGRPQRPLTAYFAASSGGAGGSAAKPGRRTPRGERAATDGPGARSVLAAPSDAPLPPLPASVTVDAPPRVARLTGAVGLVAAPSTEQGAPTVLVSPPVPESAAPVSSVAVCSVPDPVAVDVMKRGSSPIGESAVVAPDAAQAAAAAEASAAVAAEEGTAAMGAAMAVTEAAAAGAAMAAAAAVMAGEAPLVPASLPVASADAADAVQLVGTAAPTVSDAGVVINAGPPLPVSAGARPAAACDVTARAAGLVSRASSPVAPADRAEVAMVGVRASADPVPCSAPRPATASAPMQSGTPAAPPPPGWAYQRMPGVELTPSASHERQAARLAKRLVATRPAGDVVDRWYLAPPSQAEAAVPSPAPLGVGGSGGSSEADGSGGGDGGSGGGVVDVGVGGPTGATTDAPRLAPIFSARRSSRVSATRAAAEAVALLTAEAAATDGRPAASGADVVESRRKSSARPARAVRLAKPASGQCTLDGSASTAANPVAAASLATTAAAVAAAKRPRRVAPLHPFFTTAPAATRSAGGGRSGGGAGDRLPPGTSGAAEPPPPPPPDAWLSSLSSRHVGALPPLMPSVRSLPGGCSEVAAEVSSLPLPLPAVESENPDFPFVQLLDGLGVDDNGDPDAAATAETAKLTAAVVNPVTGAGDTIDVNERNIDGAVVPAAAAGDNSRSVQTTAWVDLYQGRAGVGATTGGRQLASWIRRFYGSSGPGRAGDGGHRKGPPANGRGKRQRRSTATPPPPAAGGANDSTDGRGGGDSSEGSTWADSGADGGRVAADSDGGAPLAVANTGGRRPPPAAATVRGRPVKRRRPGNGRQRFAVLTGPTASGKTAAVYAVAAELGYSVLEVSAATIRSSGRGLLDRLAEATQSQRLARGPDGGAVPATPAGVGGDVVDGPAWATAARSLVLLDDAETLLADERLFWLVLDGLVRGGARRPVIFTVNGLDADTGPVHRTLLRAAMSGGSDGGGILGKTDDMTGDGDGGFLVDSAAPASRRGLGSRASRLAVALIHMARPPLAVASALLATAAAEQRISVGGEVTTTRGRGGGGAGADAAASDSGEAAQLAAATGRDLRAALNALQFWGTPGTVAATVAAAAAPASVSAAALNVACLPLGGRGSVGTSCAGRTLRGTVRALEEHAVTGGRGGLGDGDSTPPRSMALYAACADAGLLHSGRWVPPVPPGSATTSERVSPPKAGAVGPVDAAADAVAAAELVAWARHLDILSETAAWDDPPGLPLPPVKADDVGAGLGIVDESGGGGCDGFSGGSSRGGEESVADASPAGAASTSVAVTAATDAAGRPTDGPGAGGDAGAVAGGAAEPDDAESLLPPPPVAAADVARLAGALVAYSLASCLFSAAGHKAGGCATTAVERGSSAGPRSVPSPEAPWGSVLTRLCAYANAAAPPADVEEDGEGAADCVVKAGGRGGCVDVQRTLALSLPSPAAQRDYELLRSSPPLLWTALVIPHAQAAAVVPPSASRVRAAVDYFPALRGLALADGAGAEEAATAAAATVTAAVTAAPAAVDAAPAAAALAPVATAATLLNGDCTSPLEGVPSPPGAPPPTPPTPLVGDGGSASASLEPDVITRPRRTSRPRRAAAPRRRPRLAQLGFEAADVALLRDCAMVASWGSFHGR